MGMGFKRCKMIKNDTQRCKNLYIVKSVMNGKEKRPTNIYIIIHRRTTLLRIRIYLLGIKKRTEGMLGLLGSGQMLFRINLNLKI